MRQENDITRALDRLQLDQLHRSHVYIGQALYPGDQREQERAVETLAWAIGEGLPPALRDRAAVRSANIASRLRKLDRRYRQGFNAGHVAAEVVFSRWGPRTTLHRAAKRTAALLPAQWRSSPLPGSHAIARIVQPFQPSLHLLIPLSLARHPARREIYFRYPQLVAPAIPGGDLAALATSGRWAPQAIAVAAAWRWWLRDLTP